MSDSDTPKPSAAKNATKEEARYALALTQLPWTSLSLDDARLRLSGWHFAKEVLSPNELDILYIAEALLRLIDQRDPTGYA